MLLYCRYAKWILNFLEKVRPLVRAFIFSFTSDVVLAFEIWKSDLLKARLNSIDESVLFTVECVTSNYPVAAILNQKGRTAAFMSRTFSDCGTRYPTVENEATSVIEAVRKWVHYLHGKTFTLIN